jgi:AraC family transcriptional regulator
VEKTIEQAVGRVIEAMRANLGEQFTVDDMARTAMFSKFHFSRFFQRVTGVSPGRFLSAMRLHEAKRLLVTTTLTVTDISHQVGYTSVGTFSSRFTESVGVAPTTYRQLGGFVPPDPGERREPASRPVVIEGQVDADRPDHLGLIFVGLFSDPIPRGQPVRCTVLHRAGPYSLDSVPHGTWYLLAHSVAAGLEQAVSGPLPGDQTLCIGSHGPMKIGPTSAVQRADIRLEPATLDPRVLRALLDVRSVALTVGAA